MAYWVVIFPVDVVKSAMQTDAIVKAERKYPDMLTTTQVPLQAVPQDMSHCRASALLTLVLAPGTTSLAVRRSREPATGVVAATAMAGVPWQLCSVGHCRTQPVPMWMEILTSARTIGGWQLIACDASTRFVLLCRNCGRKAALAGSTEDFPRLCCGRSRPTASCCWSSTKWACCSTKSCDRDLDIANAAAELQLPECAGLWRLERTRYGSH